MHVVEKIHDQLGLDPSVVALPPLYHFGSLDDSHLNASTSEAMVAEVPRMQTAAPAMPGGRVDSSLGASRDDGFVSTKPRFRIARSPEFTWALISN